MSICVSVGEGGKKIEDGEIALVTGDWWVDYVCLKTPRASCRLELHGPTGPLAHRGPRPPRVTTYQGCQP